MSTKVKNTPFLFNSESRKKFLSQYNSKNQFEKLQKVDDFIQKKSRLGVYMMCITILEIVCYPMKLNIAGYDNESTFYTNLQTALDKFIISNDLKIFISSILLIDDLEKVPTFAILQKAICKHEDRFLKIGKKQQDEAEEVHLRAFFGNNFDFQGFFENLSESNFYKFDFSIADFFSVHEMQNSKNDNFEAEQLKFNMEFINQEEPEPGNSLQEIFNNKVLRNSNTVEQLIFNQSTRFCKEELEESETNKFEPIANEFTANQSVLAKGMASDCSFEKNENSEQKNSDITNHSGKQKSTGFAQDVDISNENVNSKSKTLLKIDFSKDSMSLEINKKATVYEFEEAHHLCAESDFEDCHSSNMLPDSEIIKLVSSSKRSQKLNQTKCFDNAIESKNELCKNFKNHKQLQLEKEFQLCKQDNGVTSLGEIAKPMFACSKENSCQNQSKVQKKMSLEALVNELKRKNNELDKHFPNEKSNELINLKINNIIELLKTHEIPDDLFDKIYCEVFETISDLGKESEKTKQNQSGLEEQNMEQVVQVQHEINANISSNSLKPTVINKKNEKKLENNEVTSFSNFTNQEDRTLIIETGIKHLQTETHEKHKLENKNIFLENVTSEKHLSSKSLNQMNNSDVFLPSNFENSKRFTFSDRNSQGSEMESKLKEFKKFFNSIEQTNIQNLQLINKQISINSDGLNQTIETVKNSNDTKKIELATNNQVIVSIEQNTLSRETQPTNVKKSDNLTFDRQNHKTESFNGFEKNFLSADLIKKAESSNEFKVNAANKINEEGSPKHQINEEMNLTSKAEEKQKEIKTRFSKIIKINLENSPNLKLNNAQLIDQFEKKDLNTEIWKHETNFENIKTKSIIKNLENIGTTAFNQNKNTIGDFTPNRFSFSPDNSPLKYKIVKRRFESSNLNQNRDNFVNLRNAWPDETEQTPEKKTEFKIHSTNDFGYDKNKQTAVSMKGLFTYEKKIESNEYQTDQFQAKNHFQKLPDQFIEEKINKQQFIRQYDVFQNNQPNENKTKGLDSNQQQFSNPYNLNFQKQSDQSRFEQKTKPPIEIPMNFNNVHQQIQPNTDTNADLFNKIQNFNVPQFNNQHFFLEKNLEVGEKQYYEGLLSVFEGIFEGNGTPRETKNNYPTLEKETLNKKKADHLQGSSFFNEYENITIKKPILAPMNNPKSKYLQKYENLLSDSVYSKENIFERNVNRTLKPQEISSKTMNEYQSEKYGFHKNQKYEKSIFN